MSTIEAWISLDLLTAIGPRTALRLLQIYGTPEAILATPISRHKELGFLNKAQLASLESGPDERHVKEILYTLDRLQAYALCIDDPAYPQILKETDDPPCVLYCKGSLDDLQPAVAIVGTRSPSHYGKDIASRLARTLSVQGISIISGLARGIDREAHVGALDGTAKTVAVLGSGIDIMYPPEHEQLADSIAKKGAVITELPPGTSPDAKNFPRRNRIISGLCQGVIIVEATIRSGALITARYALEQGRIIMAVPGNVTNVRSQGTHHLIRQGAVLIQDSEDVLAEIAPQIKGVLKEFKPSIRQADDILTLVTSSPLSIDEIATQLDIDIMEASRRVSMLELSGAIERIEGNRYTLRSMNG
jgi:DNA processing protein